MLKKDTEKSNIKVLIPKYINEILDKDVKHFKIAKYDLCNRILIKFFLRSDTNFSIFTPFEKKEYLQFALQKENIPKYVRIRNDKRNICKLCNFTSIFERDKFI